MLTPFRAVLAATALAVLLGWGASGAAVTAVPRVTLVADSVGVLGGWRSSSSLPHRTAVNTWNGPQ